MLDNLLPCPFCGNDDLEMERNKSVVESWKRDREFDEGGSLEFFLVKTVSVAMRVSCSCGCTLVTMEDATVPESMRGDDHLQAKYVKNVVFSKAEQHMLEKWNQRGGYDG
jgi:hypothetical protein